MKIGKNLQMGGEVMSNSNKRINYILLKCEKEIIFSVIGIFITCILMLMYQSLSVEYVKIYSEPKKVVVEDTIDKMPSFYLVINQNEKRVLIETSFEKGAVIKKGQKIYLINEPSIYDWEMFHIKTVTLWFQDYLSAKKEISKIKQSNIKIDDTKKSILGFGKVLGVLTLTSSGVIVIKVIKYSK